MNDTEIIKAGMTEYINNDTMFSYWQITRRCNYMCEYCRKTDIQSDSTPEIIDKVINIYNYLETVRPVDLVISGGEPTLQNLEYVLQKLVLNNPITIFTNMSQSTDYYFKLHEFHPIKLIASYHPAYHDLDEFIRKINKLNEQIPVTIRFMILNYTDLADAQNNKSKFNSNVILEYITDHPIRVKYPDIAEALGKLNENYAYQYGDKKMPYYELQASDTFTGWTCTAPSRSLCFNWDGKIFPCKTALLKNRTPIYSFDVFDDFEKHFQELEDTTLCPQSGCSVPEVFKYKVNS